MSYPSWNTSMKTLHFDYSCLYQSLGNFQLHDEDPLFLNSSQAAGKAPCWSCACNPLDDNVFTPFANRNPILIPATLESWQHQDRLHFQYSSVQYKLLTSNLSVFINRDLARLSILQMLNDHLMLPQSKRGSSERDDIVKYRSRYNGHAVAVDR